MIQDEYEAKQIREEMEKKRVLRKNTIIFTVVTSIFNVILTLAIIMGLFILAAFLIYKVFHASSSLPLQIAMPVVFIGGLVLGFFVYSRLVRWAIGKFNLKDKLQPDVVGHYTVTKTKSSTYDPRRN